MISEQKNSNKNFDAGENDVGDFRILKAVSHPFLLIIRKQLLAEGRNGIGYNKTAKQGRAQGPYGFHNSIRLAQQ